MRRRRIDTNKKENEQQQILETAFEKVFASWLESQPRATDAAALKAIAWPFFTRGYLDGSRLPLERIREHVHQVLSELHPY